MKNFILFLGIILPAQCFSQVHASFSFGVAGFSMKEMKRYQPQIKMQLPVDAKIIESFPSYWSYEFSLTGEVNDWMRLGAITGYTSTGGRMHYADYSGEIACNQTTTAKMIGLQAEVLLNPNEGPPVVFVCKTGATLGHYTFDMLVDINHNADSEHYKFVANNAFIESGLNIYKQIIRNLSVTLYGGYNINVYKDKVKLTNNRDLYLLDQNGKPVHLDWTGFRVSVGISAKI
jgi:hypothetical protein